METGFSFDLCDRNEYLQSKGFVFPNPKKTGTTIAGVVFKDGVVLGADTRATEGSIIADKYCSKIHFISKNIYCCGAGTSADTENITSLISSQLTLHRLATNRESRVSTALTLLKQRLFQYQGHISAHLILGGYDFNGPSLHTIHAHGSSDQLPYVTMGSGSLAAMAFLEANYKPDMDKETAMNLVKDAISAGIFNDLGSGGSVNLTVIEKGKTETFEGYENLNERKVPPQLPYIFPKGTTPVLKTEIIPLSSYEIMEVDEPMEIS